MNRMLLIALAVVLALPAISEARGRLETKANVVMVSAQGAPVPLPANCCPTRCVSYKHHRAGKKVCCDCCTPPLPTVLAVQDPCVCGCFVEVPICLPGCCTGQPKVCTHGGIFGRDVVEYEWCCGYRVKIVFDRRGDVTVHTFGS
jgi:hypothetical protein